MLNDKIQKELNRQLNAELYSAYLYLSMAAHFEAVNLRGFANWFKVQSQEELTHAMKFYDYINTAGGRVVLSSVDSPPEKWTLPLEVFGHTLKHEQKVTSLINELVNLAESEKDYATRNFLQWFVTEQVEEESSANDILQKLKLIGTDTSGLFLIDRELAQRIFTMPLQAEKNKGQEGK